MPETLEPHRACRVGRQVFFPVRTKGLWAGVQTHSALFSSLWVRFGLVPGLTYYSRNYVSLSDLTRNLLGVTLTPSPKIRPRWAEDVLCLEFSVPKSIQHLWGVDPNMSETCFVVFEIIEALSCV